MSYSDLSREDLIERLREADSDFERMRGMWQAEERRADDFKTRMAAVVAAEERARISGSYAGATREALEPIASRILHVADFPDFRPGKDTLDDLMGRLETIYLQACEALKVIVKLPKNNASRQPAQGEAGSSSDGPCETAERKAVEVINPPGRTPNPVNEIVRQNAIDYPSGAWCPTCVDHAACEDRGRCAQYAARNPVLAVGTIPDAFLVEGDSEPMLFMARDQRFAEAVAGVSGKAVTPLYRRHSQGHAEEADRD